MTVIIQPVMPPLFDEEKLILTEKTSFAGETCTSIVMSVLQRKGINTSNPHIDEGEDILVKVGRNQWKTGQVKKIVYKQKEQRYEFKFQSANKTDYSEHDLDFYFHVVMTHYRTLIWQTDTKHIPKRPDGTFVKNTNLILDRPKVKRPISSKSQFPDRPQLIYEQYHPEVFRKNITFFSPNMSPIASYI